MRLKRPMRIASSPDASTFLLRMPWEKEVEILNLRRLSDKLTDDCVACLGFGENKFKVYSGRPAEMPAELPLFFPPDPAPAATLRADYDHAVSAYIDFLKKLETEGTEGKIVGARVLISSPEARRSEIFSHLRRLYPHAFVFYLSTPETGTWIGASPELLLRRDGDSLHTISLAGTRPAGSDCEWDIKNIREQAMVTEFICDTLVKHGLKPQQGPTGTRIAGPVEHLATEITCSVPDDFSLDDAASLIIELSPTPALSGLPREEAIRMISSNETFKRHLYGGCIGRVKSPDCWCFFVNLRSALLTSKGTCLYVGGGVTALSDPVREWEETELKAVTLLKVFSPQSIRVPGESAPPIKIGRWKRRRKRY